MTRWRAPDLAPDELATLDALDLADEAEARFDRYSAADRREWEAMLAEMRRGRRGRPKAEEKAAGMFGEATA